MNNKAVLRSCIMVIVVVFFAQCKKDKDEYFLVDTSNTGEKRALGKLIFHDMNLSNPIGQSCNSCHSSFTGFSDGQHNVVSPGAADGLAGNRNAPSITYAMFTPALYFSQDDSTFVGGLFLDGRVNSLEEQATKPFFNLLEMNLTSSQMLADKIKAASYYSRFQKVYGTSVKPQDILNYVADALATYERSPELNSFSSKYDYYLNGGTTLSSIEKQGLSLFNDTLKGNCAACHPSDPNPDFGKVLFTDFTYDNIGVPKNQNNPFYFLATNYNPLGANYIDYGLALTTGNASNNGQFRVPSLRNVALSAPYFHNGFFNTLEEVVHFYNARDVENFPAAEIPGNVNHAELGNLKLTKDEEKAIVAFLKTLTDGYK